MNIKIGESRVSISVEGCFRCGTSFSNGWYPFKEIQVHLGDKSVRQITLHICSDCATPDEKTAALQNEAGSGVQMSLENLNKRGSG